MRYFSFAGHRLPLGEKTYIMGILNYTPDSFSDGNLRFTHDAAVKYAIEAEENGADIIDIGAFSTRPGAEYISPEEEWKRLSSVLPDIIKRVKIPVSVDTFVPEVAEKCLDAGVGIINDVSGAFNENIASLIKKYGAGWIVMHGGVLTGRAESVVNYENGITTCVQSFFDEMLQRTSEYGIPAEKICLDPGFGFSKDSSQNTELLKNLGTLDTHGSALLSALSRKRFVGTLSGETDASKRDEATLALDIFSAEHGADMVRVHNVPLHAKALRTLDALLGKKQNNLLCGSHSAI